MTRRLDHLKRCMEEKAVDAVLVTSVHNTLYYSNFWMIPWGRLQGLVIPREGEPVLIAPRIEDDRPVRMIGNGSVFSDVRIYSDNTSAIEGWVGLVGEILGERGKIGRAHV